MMLLFFLFLAARGATPVSECPDATILHYEWGRLIMADFADNGLLDASVIYGLTPDVTNALLVGGLPPYMNLSPSGYLPRLCNNSIVNKTSGVCSLDELPCCGSPICGESPVMQTIYTLLLREHNAYIKEVSKGNAGHDPHIFVLARNHIVSLLASTCPGCRPFSGVCRAEVAADLGRLLAYSIPPTGVSAPTCDGVIICDDNITLITKTPIITITPPNATVNDALNFSYYLDITNTEEEFSLSAAVVAYWESQFGLYSNSTGLLVYLLSERHGPGEEDIIGRLAHALFTECLGVQNPPWINTAAVREIISTFYTTTCPDACTLAAADPPASASGNGSNSKVQEGSLIFFVVMIGLLAAALFIIVVYKLVV